MYCESTIMLLSVSAGQGDQEPFCLHEPYCANSTRKSRCLTGASKVKLRRDRLFNGLVICLSFFLVVVEVTRFANQRIDIDKPSKQCNKKATELLTHLVQSCCLILFVVYLLTDLFYCVYVSSGLRKMSLREACETFARA